MQASLKRITAALRRFRLAQAGAAAVEFALILPVMLLVYVGCNEASTLIILDRKVQTVSGTVGDLVAQSNKSITTMDITDYFRAATAIIAPYPADGLEQVVVGVTINKEGKPEVAWSRKYVNGNLSAGPYTKGNPFTLPAPTLVIAQDVKFVIVSEASSSYTPLLGIVFNQPIRLWRQNFFMPRFGTAITEPS